VSELISGYLLTLELRPGREQLEEGVVKHKGGVLLELFNRVCGVEEFGDGDF